MRSTQLDEDGKRVISGRIDTTTPTILGGTGFIITKATTGRVLVTPTPPFRGVPVVQVVGGPVGGTNILARVYGSDATGFTVQAINDAGTVIDGPLQFRAEGLA